MCTWELYLTCRFHQFLLLARRGGTRWARLWDYRILRGRESELERLGDGQIGLRHRMRRGAPL